MSEKKTTARKKGIVERLKSKTGIGKKKETEKPAAKKTEREPADKELFQLLTPFYKIELKIKKTMDEGGKDYNCLLLIGNIKEYSQINLGLLKYFSEKKTPGIYVTLNRPVKDIIAASAKQKIDVSEVSFIDSITRLNGEQEENMKNVKYLDSPRELIELITAIESEMAKMKTAFFIIFDSVSTMTVYNEQHAVEKFVHELSSKIKSSDCSGIIVAIDSTEEKVLHIIAQFCDATIKI